MKVLGIRFCHVTPEAEALADCLGDGLGLKARSGSESSADEFNGAIFPVEVGAEGAEGGSWIEIWPEGEGMPAGTMLQIVVDDADAWAARARAGGLEPRGPMDAHGERIYYLKAPGGLPVSFQSRLKGDES